MLIKGVDLKKYIDSFSAKDIDAFIQFLDVFDCCRNLRKALKDIKHRHLEELREEAERKHTSRMPGRRTGTVKEREKQIEDVEPDPPTMIVGVCPRCGSTLKGSQSLRCDEVKTGRIFYRICDRCTYYSEVFKIGKNQYKEIEGG